MDINDYSFHDSYLLKVSENAKEHTYDFFLNFPVDWKNNIYEKRTLRFEGVTFYNIEEIPFEGTPTILDISDLGVINKKYGVEKNIEFARRKIEIITNAGHRIIEYSNCKFI